MEEDVKNALDAPRMRSVDAFIAGLTAERAFAQIGARDALLARAAQISVASMPSLALLSERASQISAIDSQLRKFSEQITARTLEPQMAPLAANMVRMKSLATVRRPESFISTRPSADQEVVARSIAKLVDSQQADISASSRLLASIDSFRDSFVAKATIPATSSRFLREIDLASRATRATDSSIASYLAMHEAAASSVSRLAAEAKMFDAQAIARLAEPFGHFGKLSPKWELPKSIASLFEEASAGAKYLDSIRLPVIDSASAAAIARVWGEQGLDRQLRSLGIEGGQLPDPTQLPSSPGKASRSRPLMPIVRDAIMLISFLFIFYQLWDSAQMEARITGAIREDQALREKQMEAVKALIASALAQQESRQQMRFICLSRIALVRAAPQSGSARRGSVFPNQVVKPVAESSKWIQIE